MLTGKEITRMMRCGCVTIRALAEHMDVTMKRVRQVRHEGVSGNLREWEWSSAIQSVATLGKLKRDEPAIEIVRPARMCDLQCGLIGRARIDSRVLCPECAAKHLNGLGVRVVQMDKPLTLTLQILVP